MKIIDRIKGKKIIARITGTLERDRQVDELQRICEQYEKNRANLTKKAQSLYDKRKNYVKTIEDIEAYFSAIDNLPPWCKDEMQEALLLLEDFKTAVQYENSPKDYADLHDASGRTAAFMAAGGAIGAATAAFGPTAAMSLATVLGTASTGTAISALSGAAATNAALAWLGGGALAAGGAGVAGGNLVLAMFGPIGGAIAGISGAVGLAAIRKKNSKLAAQVAEQKELIKKDNMTLAKRITALQSLISKSTDFFRTKLSPSLQWIKEVKPKNYSRWTNDQKQQLEILLNNVSNMAQLINQRI